MQGKNTVLFVSSGRDLQARLIAEQLNADKDFLGIVVRTDELSTKAEIGKGKAKRILNNNFLKPVCSFLHKFIPTVRERETIKGYDGAKKQRVHNMFFRYAPNAVVVSDVNALATIKNAMSAKDVRHTAKLFVLSEDVGFDYDLTDKDVDQYFVDNVTVRNELMKRGVFAERVHVNPLAVEKKYWKTRDVAETRRRLGFITDERIVTLFPTAENVENLLDAVANRDVLVAVVSGDETISTAAVARGCIVFDEAKAAKLLAVSCAAVFAYDPYWVKRAAAEKCPTFLFAQEETDAIRYLTAGEKVRVFGDGDAFGALFSGLTTAEPALSETTDVEKEPEGEEEEEKVDAVVCRFDETDASSAENVAFTMKQLLTVPADEN